VNFLTKEVQDKDPYETEIGKKKRQYAGLNPLMLAIVLHGDAAYDVARLLFKNGARSDLKSEFGNILHCIASSSATKILRYI